MRPSHALRNLAASVAVGVAGHRGIQDDVEHSSKTLPAGEPTELVKRQTSSEVIRSTVAHGTASIGYAQQWWKEWPSAEAVRRIDTLTYVLGRYPRQPTTPAVTEICERAGVSLSAASEMIKASKPVSPASPRPCSSELVKRRGLRTKSERLRALKACSLVQRPGSRSPSTPQGCALASQGGPSIMRSEGSSASILHTVSPPSPLVRQARAPSIPETFISSAPLALVPAPLTPLAEVKRLAEGWRRRARRERQQQEKVDSMEEAAWQMYLWHPPHLYDDEEAVMHRFGMGSFVSPLHSGFSGLFRQRWQDFHVTEMVTAVEEKEVLETFTAPQGSTDTGNAGSLKLAGRPLSRSFDFSIPPLPPHLLRCAEENYDEMERAGKQASTDASHSASTESHISFFEVDAKKRIRQLQEEVGSALSEKDAAPPHPRVFEHGEADSTAEWKHVSNVPDELGCGTRGGSHHRALFGESVLSSSLLVGVQCRDPLSSDPSDAVDAHQHGRDGAQGEGNKESRRRYLQCTLHKQHIAHGNAMANIAQALRIHPGSISTAGIKDYIGDTVQRIRLERVSPAAALEANRRFRRKGLRMTLSDFSYESEPLFPGDLFGNHFRVVLRDVTVSRACLEEAIAFFAENGFPNYYGCQRFSWFAGRQDAAFALLRHNWLAFAFLFLNYTGKDRSLRELLQRPTKYPHPSQDEYRRCVVRRLRQIAIEPTDLDKAPFLSCPSLTAPLMHPDGQPFGKVEALICLQLREAYFDLHVQSRRLTAQRLSSYLWNQVLTLRLHHFGGRTVLDGDHVAPAAIRQLSTTVEDRQESHYTFRDRVTPANRHCYTIEDVVHPGFSFDAIQLPQNCVGAYYDQICAKYGLDWSAQHSRAGLIDFREPPRPIVRKPLHLSYEFDESAGVLTLQFALERGCYANVALSELMKTVRCLGSEEVTVLPLAESLWHDLGAADPGYVTALQDIYEGYQDGVGFVNDEVHLDRAKGSETKVWDHKGPLFLPEAQDPYRRAHRWGSRHLLRNSERREQETEDMKRLLFDKPLARQLKEGEVHTYAGHIVPLPPNSSAKMVYAKVMRRKKRYAGSPKMIPRMRRTVSPALYRQARAGTKKVVPSFQSLNKNSWNFTW